MLRDLSLIENQSIGASFSLAASMLMYLSEPHNARWNDNIFVIKGSLWFVANGLVRWKIESLEQRWNDVLLPLAISLIIHYFTAISFGGNWQNAEEVRWKGTKNRQNKGREGGHKKIPPKRSKTGSWERNPHPGKNGRPKLLSPYRNPKYNDRLLCLLARSRLGCAATLSDISYHPLLHGNKFWGKLAKCLARPYTNVTQTPKYA